ncbi:MAG: bifunctional tetrahydrofolate synthase/dihydrofolate synthase, partial [Pseudomonadota bacterium]
MTSPSLARWLARLETLDPARMELGLDRVARAYSRLALPEPALTLMVAGTNGKGSCVWFADRLLRMAGQSVGRYTSPHLSQFNERIAVNGKLSTDAQLV